MKKTVKKNTKTILYLHVTKNTKKWLVGISKKQVGDTSQSAIVEKILVAAKKNKKLLTKALING